ncbi:uncharacterized protein isoform X2 [Rhodnius prolixus]|uniref:uncharacterized protein isoform X2 n=1 Tax=Rhodnius prolixus TaxID=13249 RepID=UPI003D18CA4F
MIDIFIFCLRNPMITSVYYGMLTLVHITCFTLLLEDLDIMLICWVIASTTPECIIIYIGVRELNIGYLTAAAILLMMLWITFVYMYIKIVTIYYQWGYSVKYLICYIIGTVHMCYLPIAMAAIAFNLSCVNLIKVCTKENNEESLKNMLKETQSRKDFEQELRNHFFSVANESHLFHAYLQSA